MYSFQQLLGLWQTSAAGDSNKVLTTTQWIPQHEQARVQKVKCNSAQRTLPCLAHLFCSMQFNC
jgi:hypothetical protein